MMNKALKLLSILLLAFSAIGCAFIEDLLGITPDLPDLVVNSVTVSTDAATGVISSADVTLKNAGEEDAAGIVYWIMLSTDTTISTVADVAVYKGSLDLAAGAEQPLAITASDIGSYVSSNSVAIPDGIYYVGVYADPSGGITEATETDNTGVSTATVPFYGGAPMAYALRGTVTLNAGIMYYEPAHVMHYNVPDGTYDVYIGLTTDPFIDAGGLPQSATSIMRTGGSIMSQVFSETSGATIEYTIYVPVKGSYTVFAYLDRNDNGDIEYYNSPGWVPQEPYWYEDKAISVDLDYNIVLNSVTM